MDAVWPTADKDHPAVPADAGPKAANAPSCNRVPPPKRTFASTLVRRPVSTNIRRYALNDKRNYVRTYSPT